jgi:hypothetical protein
MMPTRRTSINFSNTFLELFSQVEDTGARLPHHEVPERGAGPLPRAGDQRAMHLHAAPNSTDCVRRTMCALTERLADLAVTPETRQVAAQLINKLEARNGHSGNGAG